MNLYLVKTRKINEMINVTGVLVLAASQRLIEEITSNEKTLFKSREN